MSFSTVVPPEPNIFYHFGHGSPHSALTRSTYWYMYIFFCFFIIPSFGLLHSFWKSIFNIFFFPLLKPGSLLKLFSSVPFVLHFPFVSPPLSSPGPFHPPSHRWWVSGFHRTASVQWAAPCFYALSTRLLCPLTRLVFWIRSPCSG